MTNWDDRVAGLLGRYFGASADALATSLDVALKALGRNKVRTFLTMLGMTIGVGAVLTMVALGSGAQASIEQQVRAAGLNVILVTAGNYKAKSDDGGGGVVDHQAAVVETAPGRFRLAAFHPENDPMEKHNHPTARQRLGDAAAGLGAAATLTAADAEAIRREVRGVQYVAGGVHENARVTAGDRRWFTRLHGSDLELPLIRRAWAFRHGRFFNRREMRDAAQVIVLGHVVSQKLFGEADPVGQTVRIWNQPFEVVGVVVSSSWVVTGAPGDDQFDAVYVPVTAVHRLLNVTNLNTITITAASSGEVGRVAKDVTELLRVRHRIAETKPDDFTVRTQARDALARGLHPNVARAVVGNVAGLERVTLEQLAGTLDRAGRTMTALLASIATVSLVVGGIGIMNIMLLSVTERTREIGLRLAVGARERDVLLQFLTEAVALSLAGGLAGILLGFAASGGIRQALRWSTTVTPGAVMLAFGIAAAVGVFFGFYPARKASQVDPIDALRYE